MNWNPWKTAKQLTLQLADMSEARAVWKRSANSAWDEVLRLRGLLREPAPDPYYEKYVKVREWLFNETEAHKKTKERLKHCTQSLREEYERERKREEEAKKRPESTVELALHSLGRALWAMGAHDIGTITLYFPTSVISKVARELSTEDTLAHKLTICTDTYTFELIASEYRDGLRRRADRCLDRTILDAVRQYQKEVRG